MECRKETIEPEECLSCDMILCVECFNEYHSQCTEINEDWDADEEFYGDF
jgi:hypothetical protein